MYSIRRIFTILCFLGFLGFCWGIAIRQIAPEATQDQPETKMMDKQIYAKAVDYFMLNKDQSFQLYADTVLLEEDSKGELKASFIKPKGNYDDRSGNPIYYRAQKAHMNEEQGAIILEGKAQIQQKGRSYASSYLEYSPKTYNFKGRGDVKAILDQEDDKAKLEIFSDRVEANLVQERGRFQGNVKGKVLRNKKFEQSLDFWSDSLDFSIKEGLVDLKANVRLEFGSLKARSRSAQLFLENYNKQLKYYVMNDDIDIKETLIDGEGKTVQRSASAQQIQGFAKSRKVILTGAPWVKQDGNIIRGFKMTLYQDSDIVEIDESRSNLKIEKAND